MAAQRGEQTRSDVEEIDGILGDIVNAHYFQSIYFTRSLNGRSWSSHYQCDMKTALHRR